MKAAFLTLILLTSALCFAQAPANNQKPLGKNQILDLLKAGMESEVLAKTVQERGIDFEPTDDDLAALRKAGAQDVLVKALRSVKPRPMTREQVLQLVVAGVTSQRAVTLIKQRGIDFIPDEEYLGTLRVAGADDALIAALRAASEAVTAEVTVVTSPTAEVYLDGAVQGRASAQGDLRFKTKVGVHTLKIMLTGKKDYQREFTLVAGQASKVEAKLEDLLGSIRIRTLAGASLEVDGSGRGKTDAEGELLLTDVAPGPHELRLSAPRKKDYRQTVTVLAGQEARTEAALEDAPPSPAEVRENPKDGLKYVWIPPGTFMMGCSPGDSECRDEEKPAHRVTISKGLWLGQTEVTVAAYKRFASATSAAMPSAPSFNPDWANEQMPMVYVSWADSHAYCTRAGGRLPTEAEWEYAARAGSTAARYGPLDEVAWYDKNFGGGPQAVAQKRANGFGLFDMLGNAWEWVSDWYGKRYYDESPEQDPPGASGHVSSYRVLRGGPWDKEYLSRTRASSRDWDGSDSRNTLNGFRCALEAMP